MTKTTSPVPFAEALGRYQAYVAAHPEHRGDIPRRYVEPDGYRLGLCVMRWRERLRLGTLPAEQVDALAAVGFPAHSTDRLVDEAVDALVWLQGAGDAVAGVGGHAAGCGGRTAPVEEPVRRESPEVGHSRPRLARTERGRVRRPPGRTVRASGRRRAVAAIAGDSDRPDVEVDLAPLGGGPARGAPRRPDHRSVRLGRVSAEPWSRISTKQLGGVNDVHPIDRTQPRAHDLSQTAVFFWRPDKANSKEPSGNYVYCADGEGCIRRHAAQVAMARPRTRTALPMSDQF